MEEDKMPFGKYKGMPLGEVPSSYLLYLYDRNYFNGELKKKVENLIPVLRFKKEQKNNKKN
jgi:uncharacterized protein (DUF3820 family)